jgi:hypothetical protein
MQRSVWQSFYYGCKGNGRLWEQSSDVVSVVRYMMRGYATDIVAIGCNI